MRSCSIIKEIFLKRKGNCETVPITSEQKRLLDEVLKLQEKLIEKTRKDNDCFQLVKAYSDKNTEYSAECEEDAYSEGFRIGVLVGLDVAKAYENEN